MPIKAETDSGNVQFLTDQTHEDGGISLVVKVHTKKTTQWSYNRGKKVNQLQNAQLQNGVHNANQIYVK